MERPGSHPETFPDENTLRARFASDHVFSRVRRALRATFHPDQNLAGQRPANANPNPLMGRVEVKFDTGGMAQMFNQFYPDQSYVGCVSGTKWNRAPGDVKPSWKWKYAMRNGTENERKEFRQALSQVNFYMIQNHAKYGFIITDDELILIRRRDNMGNLDLSGRIPLNETGNAQRPKLTPHLALWWLGMITAGNNWVMPTEPLNGNMAETPSQRRRREAHARAN